MRKEIDMAGKFMKIRKFVLSTITLAIIASQLCACSAVSQSELAQMCMNNEAIVIEVAEPISQESGTETSVEWTELASLDNYPDFRMDFEDLLDITRQGQGGKNGVIYVDAEGNHTNNSTLYNAFMNKKFVENYWENNDKVRDLAEASRGVYVDAESDQQALYAGINGYYNLLNDSEPGFSNLSSTLTRGEFMSFVFKADTPVYDIEQDTAFSDAVGGGEYAVFAQEMEDHSFLQTADQSLDKETFNGTITRAEAVYMLVSRYYSDELSVGGGTVKYTDAKDGGDIALKAGFATEEKDKETKEMIRTNPPGRYNSYELAYALQNPDKGMPTALYNALAVASKHNIISGTESRWDEGITKGESLAMLVRVYEDLVKTGGYKVDVSRGESVGEVIGVDGGEVEEGQVNQGTEVDEEAIGDLLANLNDLIDPDKHVDFADLSNLVIDDEMGEALKQTNIYKDYELRGTSDWYASIWEDCFDENLNTLLLAYNDGTITKADYYQWCNDLTWPDALQWQDSFQNATDRIAVSKGFRTDTSDINPTVPGNEHLASNPSSGNGNGSGTTNQGGSGNGGGGGTTTAQQPQQPSVDPGAANGGVDTPNWQDPAATGDWGAGQPATDESIAEFAAQFGMESTTEAEAAANQTHAAGTEGAVIR